MCVWGTEGCVGGQPVQRTNRGGGGGGPIARAGVSAGGHWEWQGTGGVSCMLPPLPDPREARGHTLPQPWGHHESHGALPPPWPHCPGATKCTYPGAALPANRGGSAPLHPTAHVGLHGLPPSQGGNQGGAHKGMPGVTPLPCARTLPALLGCPPPNHGSAAPPHPRHCPPPLVKPYIKWC